MKTSVACFLFAAALDTTVAASSAHHRRLNGQYQTAKLLAKDAAEMDIFGESVAISGDGSLIVAGARADDDGGEGSGSAYVFQSVDNGASWTQVDKLVANDAEAWDFFGKSVSISGDLIAVGAHHDTDVAWESGAVYVFRTLDSGASWTQVDKLVANDGASSDWLGYSIGISGSLIVAGAHGADDAGAGSGSAYVFSSLDGGASWTQAAKLVADDAAPNDFFGVSVAIDENLIVVGASFDDDQGFATGSAYVFRSVDSGASWTQVKKLAASDAARADQFAMKVAISGSLIVVGALNDDDAGEGSGAAYVYQSVDDGASWAQADKLVANDGAAGDAFGSSVAISGDRIVIGATGDDDVGLFSGSAYVFESLDSGSSWTQVEKVVANDAAGDDFLGKSVAVSGNLVVIGANGDNDAGTPDTGAAYVFSMPASPTYAPTPNPTTTNASPTFAPTPTPQSPNLRQREFKLRTRRSSRRSRKRLRAWSRLRR